MDLAKITQATATLLRARFGASVDVVEPMILTDAQRRNQIIRFRVAGGGGGVPASVIIKHPKNLDPKDPAADPTRTFSNEWAMLQTFSEMLNSEIFQVTPHFYGGDLAAGIVVTEDLGSRKGPVAYGTHQSMSDCSLVQALLGQDPVYAEAGLLALMRTLGTMHSRGRDHVARFKRNFDLVNPDCSFDSDARLFWIGSRRAAWIRDTVQFLDIFSGLGVALPAEFEEEIHSLAVAFDIGAKFATLLHSDPCPDNCKYGYEGFRLIDFEFSGIGHAFVDGSYGRAFFPSCWCCNRLPTQVIERMEGVYRAELAKGFPEVLAPGVFERGMAEACAFWALVEISRARFQWPPDSEWGIATYGVRLQTRLDNLHRNLEQLGGFPAVARATRAAYDATVRRWGGLPELPIYPAFL